MIAPFDRYAQQLTIEERREIWAAISNPRVSRSRFHRARGAAIGATAVMATMIAVFVIREQWSEDFGRIEASKLATAREKLDEVPGHAKGTAFDPHRGMSAFERDAATSAVKRQSPNVEREARAARIPSAAIRALLPSAANVEVEPRVIGPEASSGNDARRPAAGAGVVSGRITNAQNQPMPYVNVVVLGTKIGTVSREDGTYAIAGLAPGTYSLQFMALGYDRVVESVRVERDTLRVNAELRTMMIVKQSEEIEVKAQRQIDSRSSMTRQSISADRKRAKGTKARGDLHLRGGRSGEVRIQLDGTSNLPDPLPPTTRPTRLPNDEAFDSMFFKSYGVNPFVEADEDARSTFAVDVDAASYTVTRRYLELGQLPPKEAVRVEEFVNYVTQDYPRFEDDDFRILIDGAPSRFGSGYHLLRIGIKAREIPAGSRKPAQLTFVIDVSGSMAREDRLELVKRALRLLVKQLDEDDRVAIVVYGTQGRVLLEPTAVDAQWHAGRQRILDTIEQLRPEGSTNAEEGLQLGYGLARRHFRAEASNRIVLCSDGVANVGKTGAESILAQVRGDAGRGIHLTAIGFGMGNYNDVLMEQLANQGDGNYYYVDDIDEAHRVFIDHLTGTLETIAKDAKVQVEFDATRVLRYRLLGFENRDVADRDFRNDDVDAGEIGAGHEVTALYELELARDVERGTLATVRFRYARPDGKAGSAPEVREIEERFDAEQLSEEFEDAAPAFRLDAATAELAEILRGSYWAKDGRWSDVLSVARSASRDLRDETSADVVRLIEKAARLGKPSRSDSR